LRGGYEFGAKPNLITWFAEFFLIVQKKKELGLFLRVKVKFKFGPLIRN